MNLRESLNKIASKITKQQASILTEEATKIAFVMPFISALGYDVFDPEEVIPEFTADIGNKKGLKVDYAIKVNDKISIIIECKMLNSKLDALKEAQLHWYFHNTESRIGLLTDGIIYKFYTDLDNQNKMDEKPFFEFSIRQLNNSIIEKLENLTKQSFNLDKLLSLGIKPQLSPPLIRTIFDNDEDELPTSQNFLNCFALANQNDVNAQYEVGLMFQIGEEITRNYKSAIEWYKKAAEQNHLNAQLNLASMLYEKSPLDRNYTEAINWFKKTAEQGNADAQFYLGKMYQSGQGTERDLKLAEFWYLKAIENGDSDMQKRVIKACLSNQT
jgi:hypothetical protein